MNCGAYMGFMNVDFMTMVNESLNVENIMEYFVKYYQSHKIMLCRLLYPTLLATHPLLFSFIYAFIKD